MSAENLAWFVLGMNAGVGFWFICARNKDAFYRFLWWLE